MKYSMLLLLLKIGTVYVNSLSKVTCPLEIEY